MWNTTIYLIILFLVLIILYNIFLILLNQKIKLLEKQISNSFFIRTNLVPSLFDLSKKYINKHKEVFSEIIKLRKQEFFSYNNSFLEIIFLETAIHHELNFIFKVLNQNKKIQKDEKFLLIKDLFLQNSDEIWEKIQLYKSIIKKFNFLLFFKNLTILWFFINIKERKS